MQHPNNYQQFPNFSQPPPIIEQQAIQCIDDSTIDKFLIERNHLTIQSNEDRVLNHFKICGKDRHIHVIEMKLKTLIKQQKFDENNLQNNIAQVSSTLWADKINSLKINQKKIADLLRQLNELSSDRSNTNMNRKARRNKSNLKKKQQNQRKENKKIRSVADEPMKSKPSEENLQEKYQMYEIERLRGGNLKRINECKRHLALLDSLLELRCIRSKNSNLRAANESTSEKYFAEKINKLKSQWTDALEKYVSLESKFKMSLTSTCSVDWLNTLFSNETDTPFYAAINFNHLLEIRKSWDLCLVNDENVFGSSIPLGWVLPNSTPSPEWASFLIK